MTSGRPSKSESRRDSAAAPSKNNYTRSSKITNLGDGILRMSMNPPDLLGLLYLAEVSNIITSSLASSIF